MKNRPSYFDEIVYTGGTLPDASSTFTGRAQKKKERREKKKKKRKKKSNNKGNERDGEIMAGFYERFQPH